MSRKPLSLLTFFALTLSLIGCNRGCTTATTIASESRVVNTKNGNVEVVGRVIDYRHSRRVGRNIFNRSVSHSYGMSFDLRFGTFEQEEFFHEGVKDPDAVNLTEELKRAEVVISKDQRHIGLGVDGKVVDLIHLYKSNRISTLDSTLIADGTMKWSDLDIESYPSGQSILTESLTNSCNEMSYGTDAMTEFCNSSKPSSKIHRILLDKWPSCSFARTYLDEPTVKELSKDAKWYKNAIKRGETALKNKANYGSDFEEVSNFVLALESDKLNDQLDEILLANWGKTMMTDFSKVLVERIESNTDPLDKQKRKIVYNDAKKGFAKFMNTGRSEGKYEADNCLRILSALGDTTAGHNFVQNAFGPKVKKLYYYDFVKVAYDDFSVFTEHQQQEIIKKTEITFEHIEPRNRWIYFSSIRDIVDCAMLVRLKKRYPQDLESSIMPMRCKP